MKGWNWAQWAVLVTYLVELGYVWGKWGQPREPRTVSWQIPMAHAFMIWLLIKGGFWEVK